MLPVGTPTKSGCRRLSNEVYDCDSLDEVRYRCEQFFDLMPGVAADE